MKSLLFFTCILSGLVSSGYSLSCMHCQAEGELSCTGDEKKCSSDSYVCAATSTISIIEGVARKTFSRSCEKRSSCGISGTIGYLRGKVKTATSCCYIDGCTPSSPPLPGDSSQRVGLTCSSCTSQDSTWCHTSETIECTGDEKKCLFQATTTWGPKQRKSAVRGCASKNLCDIGSQNHDFGNGIKVNTEVTCTSGSISVTQNLGVLTLIALLSVTLLV